jgi:hypothetical protein
VVENNHRYNRYNARRENVVEVLDLKHRIWRSPVASA